MKRTDLVLLVLLCGGASFIPAAVPPAIQVQGYLSDSSGGGPAPATGTYTMEFEIWDAVVGGQLLVALPPMAVDVLDGLYTAEIPVSPAVFDEPDRYLQIAVNGETLDPRLRIVSTPFAMRSGGIAIACPDGQVLVSSGGDWACGDPFRCATGTFADCYTGPPGTDGVGECARGSSACNDTGTGYGPCTGEVLPVAEICGNGLDDDCSGQVDDGCSVCGNDVIEAGETCDGTDLGGATCISLGYPDGTLQCSADCSSFDLVACGTPCVTDTDCPSGGASCSGGVLTSTSTSCDPVLYRCVESTQMFDCPTAPGYCSGLDYTSYSPTCASSTSCSPTGTPSTTTCTAPADGCNGDNFVDYTPTCDDASGCGATSTTTTCAPGMCTSAGCLAYP